MGSCSDRSTGCAKPSWSQKRLGVACKVLEWSPCQYVYCCCFECLPATGFVLFRNYKSQFTKLLQIISNDFLKALRERGDPDLNPVTLEIQSYIEDNKFCQEPEGMNLQGQLLSASVGVPGPEPSRGNFYGSGARFLS